MSIDRATNRRALPITRAHRRGAPPRCLDFAHRARRALSFARRAHSDGRIEALRPSSLASVIDRLDGAATPPSRPLIDRRAEAFPITLTTRQDPPGSLNQAFELGSARSNAHLVSQRPPAKTALRASTRYDIMSY